MFDPLKMQQQNVLAGLRESHEQIRRSEDKISRLVAAAREMGVSWQSIGSVLGVSKQAAWERYGKNDPHPARNRPPEED
jgi:uncharacterized protein with PIN domain